MKKGKDIQYFAYCFHGIIMSTFVIDSVDSKYLLRKIVREICLSSMSTRAKSYKVVYLKEKRIRRYGYISRSIVRWSRGLY